ncbi:TetR/AcrR family transcriptional regulator [Streptomyces sp. NPDC001843]|uniref:TetR/AcrR family transcriptional regulator n=1 Tax=Streptomyces sp. NPDC001843 TaxID=3364617 RepID=UPI00368C60EE
MVQKSGEVAARPRGRPRKFDEAEVAERMRDVFWNKGYAATALDDLVAASQVNRPSLYAAFGNKHAIYLRVLEDMRAVSIEGIETYLAGDDPLPTALHDFLLAAAESTLAGDEGARGCFIVCTAVTEALQDADTRTIAARYVADADRVFRERFERSADELKVGVDPASAAAIASAVLQSLAIRARTGSTREDLVRIADAAVTVICG